ncbi:hypothetical protein SLEP1_g14336 [Rubroshorea leprosula]|uniref:Transposase (putative) gypsy type domain-containing protein n=1 Tax=Rubroshorea leprosula TaxID=152421 RepID=A0AAV5IPN4_9ROSI|nr:hypothetical protein SLEP1_g14336 [Rubroshorea leprosula]
MDFFRELRELRGNQGREEEEGVISAEPIAMIVLPALQDLQERITPESSASSSVGDDGGDHHASPSNNSSSKQTPSHREDTRDVVGNVLDLLVVGEWESKIITGRLSNLRKEPKDLPSGFRFRAVLHHEVTDNVPSISGYKKLEEMTGWILVCVDHFDASLRFPLPSLIFDLLVDYELALTQLTPNNIRFIIGFMLLCERLEIPAKAIVFRSLFQCRLCPNSRGAKWYYLFGREKNQLFKNVRNKVARWKRQFVFVHHMRTERINNDLATRLSKCCVPNTHANYPQLLPRDTDLKNQLLDYARGEQLINLEALVTLEQLAVFGFVNRQTRFDEWPPPALQSRSSSHRGSSSASRPRTEHRVEAAALSARRRLREDTDSEDEIPFIKHRMSLGGQPAQAVQFAVGFSYVKTDYQPVMVQGMQSFVPPVDRQRAKGNAFSYAIALFESEQGACAQNSELSANCKQLAAEKASLMDDINPKDEAAREERAKKAEAERNNALNELISITRAQGAEWLVGSATFQDTVAVAFANMTTKIYNEIFGKVLQHRPDFPIHELAFVNGEDLDEEGKSLAPLVDTTMRLRWELNEEGVPIWPSSILEEGEDPEGLPSFDSWVEGALVVEPEPLSTPPSAQPAVMQAGSPVTAPAHPPAAQSSPTRASDLPVDSSMPVDLTDD